jgi:hypothetical protein
LSLSIIYHLMDNIIQNQKKPSTKKILHCEKCNFTCSNKKDFSKHLLTKKHNRVLEKTPDSDIPKEMEATHECVCGKKYMHITGLYKHKKKCTFKEEIFQEVPEVSSQEVPENTNREIIDKLVTSNTEMRDMVMMLVKSQMQNQENTKEITKEIMQETSRQNQEMQKQTQENTENLMNKVIGQTQETTANLMNKVVEVLPQMGNTTNNNNTLNFYLTDTCKDAESIHEFTDRFIERVVKFFRGNYRDIAYKRISLPDNVRDIFYECLDENPQTQNFVQTTDVKNGVCYVKEKKKNEECEYYGEAEFVKYKDGFTKSGIRLGHAINCALLPCKSECLPMLAKDFKEKPNEEDYDEEHEEDFQRDKDSYYNTTRAIQDTLMYQTIKAMNIFDSKKTRDNTLTKTKRTK